jgi:hypothetical protein
VPDEQDADDDANDEQAFFHSDSSL